MENDFLYSFFYSVGTILAGYLFVVPAWIVSLVWNKFFPRRAINPWTLPWFTSISLMVLLALGVGQPEPNDSYPLVAAFGFVPAVAWCSVRRRRHTPAPGQPAEL